MAVPKKKGQVLPVAEEGQLLAIAATKGGVGKTTLSTALAGALQSRGEEVALVDADPQRNSSEWYEGQNVEKYPVLNQITLIEHAMPDLHLRAFAKPGRITIIDCPPGEEQRDQRRRLDTVRASPILESAMKAADFMLVPCRPTHTDARSLPKLAKALKELERPAGRPPLRVAVVINQARLGSKLERRTQELREGLPEGFHLFTARVRRLDDFDEAYGASMTPLEYRPTGNAAADLTQLVDELLTWMKRHA